MKVAYVGNFTAHTERGEPFNTESHVALTLESMGHEVLRLQEDRHSAASVAHAVAEYEPDMFLWTRTWPERLRSGGLEMLRRLPCPSVAYHLDLYAGLERSQDIDAEPWWRCKHAFTADGGSDAFWRAHGVHHHWAPPAVYGPECYLAEPGPERYDVIFVGSGSNGYHPEWPHRPRLIEFLRQTYGRRFAVFGRGGVKECVRGGELNELYASAKVVVGDSLCLGYTHSNYWSDRVPETLGRGGFLLHPYVRGMEDHYVNGEHLVHWRYGDWPALKQTIDHYLVADEERETIRRQGHLHVKAHHTYRHRMEAMLAVVGAGS